MVRFYMLYKPEEVQKAEIAQYDGDGQDCRVCDGAATTAAMGYELQDGCMILTQRPKRSRTRDPQQGAMDEAFPAIQRSVASQSCQARSASQDLLAD